MPGLSRNKAQSFTSSSSGSSLCTTSSDSKNSIWSRSNTEDVTYSQLQKFWNGLPVDARRSLLRIDKQTLFEQVRKNLYCSRCHGLLVEGFSQIVMYGKNIPDGRGSSRGQKVYPENEGNGNAGGGYCSTLQDDARDPSLHPWGGLAATRDCMLTVLDCFIDGTSLEVLQNVFENARGRERERELLYPDACGGNGRGWIGQSSSIYASGRGHGIKETCALHTTRLSCEALVDFWSALSEETRRALLRMKEEDFIERLMFRFDSKRFCRDCRRNVLREFKEMKELKRTRKEPRCTPWFCAADTTFQYEVSDTTVQADWGESIAGEVGTTYQHFEWALGTAEGKSDIFGFEDVGLSDRVEVEGLDLGSISDCFITLRAWKRDGRCNDFTAKAHALKGELCVHRRLFVGDGIVSITEGESIQRFFEHAEETEEEEDEDGFDKDGNELDGEGSRSQKHAKSPELARDFLLDAATVIFKEQVEKAFREGTARQNAHSIFVCLALGSLEDRVRVACKEIATLEKQNKLLEEEEHEKREEEERRERRKLKEKEKKLRRKEKLKCKEREKEKGKTGKQSLNRGEESTATPVDSKQDEEGSDMIEVRLVPDESEGSGRAATSGSIVDIGSTRDGNGMFIIEQSKAAKRRSNGKRQQVADSIPVRFSRRTTSMVFEKVSHRSSSDSAKQERQTGNEPLKARNGFVVSRKETQQCACSTTFWPKGRPECLPNVTKKAEARELHVRAGFKSRPQTAISQKLSASSELSKSRKEGLTYTKVLTKGFVENLKADSQLNGVVSCPVNDPMVLQPVKEADEANGSLSCSLEVEKSPDSRIQVEHLVDPTEQERHCEADEGSGNQLENIDGDIGKASERTKGEEKETNQHQSLEAASPVETSTTPAATSPVSAAPSTSLGTTYHPACSPEVPRNGYGNGYITGGSAKSHHTYTTVVEMLPVHPPPPPPPHIHRHPSPQSQQPGFACYPPVHGPWGGPQARSTFIAGPSPVFIPGPAAFGYPRYPVPRIFHPPLRMPALSAAEMVSMQPSPHPRPSYTSAWIPVDAARPLLAPDIQEQQQSFKVAEGTSPKVGEPMQTATFSLQELQKEFRIAPNTFSLFHFGGAPAAAAAAATTGPGGCSSSKDGNDDGVSDSSPPLVPDSCPPPTLASSEAKDEEVVVSSKCMDRLPSGINKPSMNTGEYSLFAAAPGKGFGFF